MGGRCVRGIADADIESSRILWVPETWPERKKECEPQLRDGDLAFCFGFPCLHLEGGLERRATRRCSVGQLVSQSRGAGVFV